MNKFFRNLITFVIKALITFVIVWIAIKVMATSATSISPMASSMIVAVLAVLVDYICDVIIKKIVPAGSNAEKFTKNLEWM